VINKYKDNYINIVSGNTMTTTDSSVAERYTGCVKWFNNKAGFGFITGNDNTDYFVHHSGISTEGEMYSYLVQGEYVTYDLSNKDGEKVQAVSVRGVEGGQLMCETRQRTREERQTYQSTNDSNDTNSSSNQQRRPSRRPQRSFSGAPTQGRRPQQTVRDNEGNTYRLVPDKRQWDGHK
jgi:cold shock protein